MRKITIAIDGYSSCGKSTMAKQLAKKLGYIYVDTGAMYRSVTLYALRRGLFAEDGTVDADTLKSEMGNINISFKVNDQTGQPDTYLNDELVEGEIRTLRVSNHVSPIAALPFVREAMVVKQRQMGLEKGVVMDGRDIGTTVFPDAELKIYLTASARVRAERRFKEMAEKGALDGKTLEEIEASIIERDERDMTRETSPLRQADDAHLVDSSAMTIEEVTAAILGLIHG